MSEEDKLQLEIPEEFDASDRIYQNVAMLVYAARALHAEEFEGLEINEFFETFVQPTREYGEPKPNLYFNIYEVMVEQTGEENNPEQRKVLIPLGCAHIGEALRFADDGFRDDAWESLLMAQYTIAKLSGFIDGEKKNTSGGALLRELVKEEARHIISDRARRAADKTHEANRATRNDAYRWLDEHFEKGRLTIDQAAEALQKIVPMEFSTRRSYVKSWKRSR